MFNINNIVEKEYSAADRRNNSSNSNALAKCINLFFVTLKLLLVEAVSKIYYLFCPRKPENISKQLALVTGGGNGLGRELCFRLAKENCDVAVVDIDYQNATKTAAEIREKFGVKSLSFQCDVSNCSALVELKNKVEKDMKTVDILVLNAGLLYLSDFITSEFKDMQKVIDVNLTSQFILARLFLPGMIEQERGKIVSVSSVSALNPLPGGVVYTSTKFAITGFMECLHDELSMTDKDEFIKLTTVYPDFMNTRKELSDALDQMNYLFPRLSPERVADETINAMLMNKRKLVISDIKLVYFMMRQYPDRIRKKIFNLAADVKALLK